MLWRRSLLPLLLLACGAEESTPTEPLSGEARLFGRDRHDALRVWSLPEGSVTRADAEGRFEVPPTERVRVEATGFGSIEVPVQALEETLTLYRGRALELPVEPTRGEALGEEGLLLWHEGGGLALDLSSGATLTRLAPGSEAITDFEGWLIAHDERGLHATALDGSGEAEHRGAWRIEGRLAEGLLLSRAWPNQPALQLSRWHPTQPAAVLERPVLELGPIIDGALTFRSEAGLESWTGETLEALATFAEEEGTPTLLDALESPATRLCYSVRAPERVECLFGAQKRAVARPPAGSEVALLGGRLVVWRSQGQCDAALGPQDQFEAFPCESLAHPAWPSRAGVALLIEGRLQQFQSGGQEDWGPAYGLSSEAGRMAFVDGEGRATLTTHSARLRASLPLEAGARSWSFRQGALFADAAGALVWLGEEGSVEVRLAPEHAPLATEATEHLVGDRFVLIAGERGVLRLDRLLRSVEVATTSWAGHTEHLALTLEAGAVTAVDLRSGGRDPLAPGHLAGFVGPHAWVLGERGLQVIDEPGGARWSH